MYTESGSCLIQDFAKIDKAGRCRQVNTLIERCLNDSEYGGHNLLLSNISFSRIVVEQWKDKQASRAWEQLVQCADEDSIDRLFRGALASALVDLATHRYANFPLQKLLVVLKSDELVCWIYPANKLKYFSWPMHSIHCCRRCRRWQASANLACSLRWWVRVNILTILNAVNDNCFSRYINVFVGWLWHLISAIAKFIRMRKESGSMQLFAATTHTRHDWCKLDRV